MALPRTFYHFYLYKFTRMPWYILVPTLIQTEIIQRCSWQLLHKYALLSQRFKKDSGILNHPGFYHPEGLFMVISSENHLRSPEGKQREGQQFK